MTISTSTSAARAAPPAAHPRRWRILAVVLLAQALDLLDATVMNVAAPSVSAGLGGGVTIMQWLTAGYTLAFGVLLIVGGRLGDRWGRRRLFVLGAAGFTAASAVCAMAPSPAVLVAARVAQGAFGALMIPQGFGVLSAVFDERERGRAFATFGPVMALAGVGGPVLAGGLIALDPAGLDWRLIFLINLPLGALTVVGALRWMPADPGDPLVRIDAPGAALVAMGSALVVHPLIQGREAGWPWWTFAEIAAGIAAFAAFGRRQRTSRSPVLVPSLLRKPAFVGGLAVTAAFFTGLGGLLLVLSLHLRLDLGRSAWGTALSLSPLAVGIGLASLVAPSAAGRLGRSLLHLGLGVEALGTLGLAAVAASGSWAWALSIPTLVVGLGVGLVSGTLVQSILAAAEPAETGSASGTLNALQQLSTALGVAVLGTVYFAVHDPGTPDPGADGLVIGALVVTATCLVGAALVLLLPRPAPRRRNTDRVAPRPVPDEPVSRSHP
ncbi:MFS transporter [Embleya scabrispora]|uniref:MFS transporter n=1 Tax=Embleya scabrispora TaxID=159449 RepID=UPI00036568DF|nr:MFS transporter [Embleya scabrispora]MYS85301.1 MFS transporter [Streptomyces sp. SID5474]